MAVAAAVASSNALNAAKAVTANRAELIAIADAVAREKSIDRMIVIEAMEEAIQRAARARYGSENDIRAKLDPKTGDLRLWRVLEVVEEPEDFFKQVSLRDSAKLQKDAALGDFIIDPLPPIEFGRIAAQAAKQVIVQKVRDAERDRQYEEYKDRVNEIITGIVKRAEFGHVVVDLGKAEGIIRRDQQIPREVLRVGDRVRTLILSVRREVRGPQIFLSRAAGEFILQILPARFGIKILRAFPGQILVAQEIQRALARQQHAFRPLHHRARRQDRVAWAENTGNRPSRAILAAHHRRVHFLLAGRGVDRPAPGVEQRIILQRHDGLGHCIERGPAIGEHRMACTQRGGKSGAIGGLARLRHGVAVDGAGAAVDG